jgi:hypothetical protein
MAKRRDVSKSEKMLEKNANDFAEELAVLAENIGVRFKDKHPEKKDGWGFRVFGFVGPLLGSVFGVLFLMFFAWIVNFINLGLNSFILSGVSSFFWNNAYWFFVLFLFFGYSDYISKRFEKKYWVVSPFVSSAGLVFIVWISIWALNMINIQANSVFVNLLSNFLYSNMFGIMFAFIILDYVLILIEKTILIED